MEDYDVHKNQQYKPIHFGAEKPILPFGIKIPISYCLSHQIASDFLKHWQQMS